MSIAVCVLVSLPACSAPKYVLTNLAAEKAESPESIADSDILSKRTFVVHEKETECTLFVRREEIRMRVGKREYVILGTSGTYGIPIPFTATMIKESGGEVMIESEEGMIGISVNMPNIAEGELFLRDEAVVEYIESLDRTTDRENLMIVVLRGEVIPIPVRSDILCQSE